VLPEQAADIRQVQAVLQLAEVQVHTVPPEQVPVWVVKPEPVRAAQQVLPEHLQAFRTPYKTFPDLLPVIRNWNRT
jgi:hypothetical protein